MATISNVKLKINDGRTSDERQVIVTYQLDIGQREAEAGTAFMEMIRLYGDDRKEGGGIESLKLIKHKLILADKLGVGPHSRTKRKYISKQILNEDDPADPGDPYGWDELFVLVRIRPFVPKSAQVESPTVACSF